MDDLVTQNDVKTLIATLRTVYASQFNKHFPLDGKNAISMQTVEKIASNTLIGVGRNQFQRGLILLNTSGRPYMPSFAEFRSLCIGQDWWNAEKAWVKACDYTKIMTHKKTMLDNGCEQYQEITTIAKFALDQVYLLIQDGEMHKAKAEFFNLYCEYLTEAQIKGRVQEWHQEPLQLTWDNDKKEHVPVPNDIAQQQLESLMKKLHVKKTKASQPQNHPKPKQATVENYWPDPFDQPEAYLNACALDGVPVAPSIARQFGGNHGSFRVSMALRGEHEA